MKQANRCSKQAGVCFKAERCLFQSRQAPAIKRRTHLSEQSDTSFKQSILFRLILQARMSTNPEMIFSEEISAILKQSAVCLRQVDACSNRPTSDSNRGVPCFVSLKFKRNNFVQNQPRQASKVSVKNNLKRGPLHTVVVRWAVQNLPKSPTTMTAYC